MENPDRRPLYSVWVSWRTDENDFILTRLDFEEKPTCSAGNFVRMAMDVEYTDCPECKEASYDIATILLVPYEAAEVIF